MSWAFTQANGTTCIDEAFFGFSRQQCAPTWYFWTALVLVVLLLIINGYRIARDLRRD